MDDGLRGPPGPAPEARSSDRNVRVISCRSGCMRRFARAPWAGAAEPRPRASRAARGPSGRPRPASPVARPPPPPTSLPAAVGTVSRAGRQVPAGLRLVSSCLAGRTPTHPRAAPPRPAAPTPSRRLSALVARRPRHHPAPTAITAAAAARGRAGLVAPARSVGRISQARARRHYIPAGGVQAVGGLQAGGQPVQGGCGGWRRRDWVGTPGQEQGEVGSGRAGSKMRGMPHALLLPTPTHPPTHPPAYPPTHPPTHPGPLLAQPPRPPPLPAVHSPAEPAPTPARAAAHLHTPRPSRPAGRWVCPGPGEHAGPGPGRRRPAPGRPAPLQWRRPPQRLRHRRCARRRGRRRGWRGCLGLRWEGVLPPTQLATKRRPRVGGPVRWLRGVRHRRGSIPGGGRMNVGRLGIEMALGAEMLCLWRWQPLPKRSRWGV